MRLLVVVVVLKLKVVEVLVDRTRQEKKNRLSLKAERKVGSIVRTHLEYPEDEEGVHPSRKPQRAGLIAEEAPMNVPDEYADFADVFSLIRGSTNMLSNWSMPTDSSDHLSHLQVLPFFSTGSRTDPFGCTSGDSIT